jgi:F0F1-type ATP synthase assembly protein I
MRFADLGIRLAVIAALFSYGGHRLDQWLDTGPWLLLTGCLLGFGGGMWSVVSAVNSMGGPQHRDEEQDQGDESR